MRHPLEFLPSNLRKPFFFTLLVLTVVLFAVFRVLDQPLRTPAAPNGIVSFELAGTPEKAFQIMVSWGPAGFQDLLGRKRHLVAAFGLGIDYLFMPAYSLALALGILLAAERHSGLVKSFGGVAGWGAVGASLFDALENYALFQILLGKVISPYPEIAAICAAIKFGLILAGILYALVAAILPRRA